MAPREPLTSVRPPCPPTGEAFGPGTCKEASSRGSPPAVAQAGTRLRWDPGPEGGGGPSNPAPLGGVDGGGLLRGSRLSLPFAPSGSRSRFGSPLSPRSPAQKGRKTLARAAPGGRGCQPGRPRRELRESPIVGPSALGRCLFLFHSGVKWDPRSSPLGAFPAEEPVCSPPRGLILQTIAASLCREGPARCLGIPLNPIYHLVS